MARVSSTSWSPTSGPAWLNNRLVTRHPHLYRLIAFIRFLIWLPGALYRGLVHLVRFIIGGLISLFIADVIWHLMFGWPR